jgi:hypothetical protein
MMSSTPAVCYSDASDHQQDNNRNTLLFSEERERRLVVVLEAPQPGNGRRRGLLLDDGGGGSRRGRVSALHVGDAEEVHVVLVRHQLLGQLLDLVGRLRLGRRRGSSSCGDGRGGAVGEVDLGLGAPDAPGGAVVGARGGLGGGVGAEPDADALHRVADLRRPLAPRPLPDAAVLVLALTTALGPRTCST